MSAVLSKCRGNLIYEGASVGFQTISGISRFPATFFFRLVGYRRNWRRWLVDLVRVPLSGVEHRLQDIFTHTPDLQRYTSRRFHDLSLTILLGFNKIKHHGLLFSNMFFGATPLNYHVDNS